MVCHLAEQDLDFGRRLVDTVMGAIQTQDGHPLHDHHAQTAALRTLAKARVENFVSEVARLLTSARWPLDLAICDALWIAADSHAEATLISQLGQTTADESRAWLQRGRIVRALGTCGLQAGAEGC